MTTEPIKGCPFCGGDAEADSAVERVDNKRVLLAWVECLSCSAQGPLVIVEPHIPPAQAEEEAIEEWNERYQESGL